MTSASSAALESSRHPRFDWKMVAIYYAIACGLSWILWAPLILGEEGLRILRIAPPGPVMIALGTLGPLTGGFAAHRLQTGNWQAVRLLPSASPRGIWLLLGPAMILVCFFVVFPAVALKGSPAGWRWHCHVLWGIVVPMFNYNLLAGPLFEEFGWRGFLQPRLQTLLPPWIGAVIVGAMWSMWHLPLFLLKGWSSASPHAYLLIVTGLATVMAFAFNASGMSLLVAILMHSAFNSSPRFLGPYLDGNDIRDYPSGEWLIAAAFVLVALALIIATRGRLAATSAK